MSGPLVLGDGLRVEVTPPDLPTITVAPPAGPNVIVVPVVGPGTAESATHRQDVPEGVWVVDHGLGRRPVAWSLYDADDQLRDEYVVEHPTLNRAVVRMDVPTAGTIRMI